MDSPPTRIPFEGTSNASMETWLNNVPDDNMVIRRSLIGSLRQAASFSTSPVTSKTLSEPAQSHSDTSKRSIKTSPPIEQQPIRTRAGGPSSKASSGSAIRREEGWRLLKLDQTVDLVCLGKHSVNEFRIFEQCLPQDATINRIHPLFHLPTAIRMKIYGHCFPDEPRSIVLSPSFATAGAFEEGHFALPFDVLDDVCGGLEAFRAIRHELMTYFWTQFRFHVTLTPFTGPKFSPLSQIWLPEYLPIVQYLTVEVDFTRFGGGYFKGAADFGFYMEKTDKMLYAIMLGLNARRGTTIMMEVNLLCRRYAGFRAPPVSSKGDVVNADDEGVPYCPELATLICDSICEMRGLLQTVRLCGFTRAYTEMLIRAVFGEGDIKPDWFAASEPAWPLFQTTNSISETPVVLISHQPEETSPNLDSAVPSKALSASSPEASLVLTNSVTPEASKLTPSEIDLAELPLTPKNRSNSPAVLPSSVKSVKAPPKSQTSSCAPGTPSSGSASTTPLFGPYTNPSAVHPESFTLKLSRSRGFRKDFEEEMLKSKYSYKYGEDHLLVVDSNTSGKGNHEDANTEELKDESPYREGVEELELENIYDDDSLEIPSNPNNFQGCQDILASPTDAVKSATTGLEPFKSPDCAQNLMLAGPLTPTGQNNPIFLNSPNAMNRLNEKDPAFLRTMDAIRGRSPTRIPGPAPTAQPRFLQNVGSQRRATQDTVVERWVTSFNNQTNGTKRKYLTFVNRFKGRGEEGRAT